MAISNQAAHLARVLTLAQLMAKLQERVADCKLVCGDVSTVIDRVVIDTRALDVHEKHSLFVAIKGARIDAHDLLADLSVGLVAAVLVDGGWAAGNPVVVKQLSDKGICVMAAVDPLVALRAWAAAWIDDCPQVRRIGVTGSSGKTTTKDMVLAVLSVAGTAYASSGNLNSVIGLPLAVLAMPADVSYAIYEMAMSEPGEMAALAAMVRPHVAIITGIGSAHLANLGSRDAIAREKKAVSSAFGGFELLLVPESDSYAAYLSSSVFGRIKLFGTDATRGYKGWSTEAAGQRIALGNESFYVPLAGGHIRSDVLAVVECAREFGMEDAAIARGFAGFSTSSGRGEVIEGFCTVVMDCYNANPESMSASLRAFAERTAPGRKIVVLGDMLELGSVSLDAHREIGFLAAGMGIALCLFIGPAMKDAYNAALLVRVAGSALCHAENIESAKNILAGFVNQADTVLLKASRGMALERLLPAIQEGVRA